MSIMNYRTRQFRSIVGINIKFTLRTISDMKYTYNTHPSLGMFPAPHTEPFYPSDNNIPGPLSSALDKATLFYLCGCHNLGPWRWVSLPRIESQHHFTYDNVLQDSPGGTHLIPFSRLHRYTGHTPCILIDSGIIPISWSLSIVQHPCLSLFSILLV